MNSFAFERKSNFYISTIHHSSLKPVIYVNISILAHLFLNLLHKTFNSGFNLCQVKVRFFFKLLNKKL